MRTLNDLLVTFQMPIKGGKQSETRRIGQKKKSKIDPELNRYYMTSYSSSLGSSKYQTTSYLHLTFWGLSFFHLCHNWSLWSYLVCHLGFFYPFGVFDYFI